MNNRIEKRAKNAFGTTLLRWNQVQNKREMPWKGEKDPYKIWLSEIILQQTRVEQGLKYYERFITTFPAIQQLANAKDGKVFKLWEGLGYYTRCRNLLVTARYISTERNGKFPDTYEEIKSLKGIGPYTAAAISSFAFNLPHAVVDGNVFRLLARYFGIRQAIDSTAGKNYFTELAQDVLVKDQAGIYNQAIMDFGAVVCKPQSPLCSTCVFKKNCVAFKTNTIIELPVKEKKVTIRKRWFYYIILLYKNQVAIRKRVGKDIWQDLFEFPLIEFEKAKTKKEILEEIKKWLPASAYSIISVSEHYKQQLSHQFIAGQFFIVQLIQKPKKKMDWQWISIKKIKENAFPQFINQFLKNKFTEQNLTNVK